MKKCKIKGCERKQDCKEYCTKHYRNDLYKRSEKFREGERRRTRKFHKKYYKKPNIREKQLKYQKEEMVHFRFLGKTINVFTNGVTEEIKPLIPMIKNKVLNDCIRNPARYLYGDKKKEEK